MNTESKHTPGPWHLGMKPGPIVYGPQGEQVANMHVAMLDQEEHRANARLIALAPQLKEHLERLIHITSHPKATRSQIKFIANDARQLLNSIPE